MTVLQNQANLRKTVMDTNEEKGENTDLRKQSKL